MSKHIVVELVEALESGNYVQVRNAYLEGTDSSGKPACCAIGALMLARGATPGMDACGEDLAGNKRIKDDIESALDDVQRGLDMDIIEFNDHGRICDCDESNEDEDGECFCYECTRPTFNDIARKLRTDFPALFES